jgi:hypothetical protein
MTRTEQGFSYIDVMIAITILLIGILALCAAMTAAVVRASESEHQLIAKQIASSTLESIFSARDIAVDRDLEADYFGRLRNVADGGIFLDGPQLVYPTGGADGILHTADDAEAGDDPIDGYERRVVITDIPDPERPGQQALRRVEITVLYRVGPAEREETMTTVVASYREDN